MSDSFEPPQAQDEQVTPSELLPDVQPPTAGFILQLFVIPGVIVLVVIMVWLLFTWLAHMGGDPKSYLDAMRQNRPNSWQQATNLVEEIRQREEYRKDPELAKEVAKFLGELLDKPLPKADPDRTPFERDARSEEIARRGFLCKALGEFETADDALPVLIRAAGSHSAEDELKIRLAALESLALLADNLHETKPLAHDDLMPLLLSASRDEDHKIALRAVTALGALGTPEAIQRLEQVVGEPHHVDVHYNAATALARHGNAASLELLLEMLDPDESRATASEADEQAKAFKRAVVMLSGLKATRLLAETNTEVDLGPLTEAVQRLKDAEVPNQIRLEAAATLRTLGGRQA